SFCMFGAVWRSAEILIPAWSAPARRRLRGGPPSQSFSPLPSHSVEERNSILSQLTEKRDRSESPAAAIIPSATDADHGVCLDPIGPGCSTRGSNHMMWRVGKVENIDMGSGFIPSPGFTIQQDGRSPTLTIIFEDLKTAEQCASSMREIIDKATAIRGRD